jgi:DNA-binding response OmpR family regulator
VISPQSPFLFPSGFAWTALVVEDEVMIATSIEDIVGELGAREVVVLRSPEAAVREAARRTHDLAIVDWRLGGRTAEALVRLLDAAGTDVLLVTGMHPEDLADMTVLGIPILEKPFRDDVLAATIRAIMTRRVARNRQDR